jgi:hypothetical protein
MDLVQVGHFEQLLRRIAALTRAPMSVFRAVTMPSNGATMFLKDSIASSRFTLALAASDVAFVAVAASVLSSAAC